MIIMPLKLFNTLSRKKEDFKPLKDNEVGMYTCGPTVYLYAHIGNLRAYLFEDILKRVLTLNGFKVKHVMNITDVGHLTSDSDTGEDKVELSAQKENRTAWEIAEFYTKIFFEDLRRLNILMPDIICKATDHIKEIEELIKKLEKKGVAYRIDDGIYFNTAKFKNYGKMAKLDLKKLKPGARVERNPQKINPYDFALWKFSPRNQKRQMEWNFEEELSLNDEEYKKLKGLSEENLNVKILNVIDSGKIKKVSVNLIGFPGWHIECSAMSMKYLGNPFDIHCGGIDHIPIHHTNEIAQSEAATGKQFVKYWLHGAFLVLEKSAKMAKSGENFLTLQTLVENDYSPLDYRYFSLTAHYRSELKFSWKNLESAKKSLQTLREHIKTLKKDKNGKTSVDKVRKYKKKFEDAINDDLNTPEALSVMWEVLRSKEQISSNDKLRLILEFDRIFGLKLGEEEVEEKLTEEIENLIRKREEARKAKDFETADDIRDELKEMGIILEDAVTGVKWKKIKAS
jgi:cysteinyl-tRNA synthetase